MIIIAILVALFATHYVFKIHETKAKEEVLDSGVIIRPAESSDSSETSPETTIDKGSDETKTDDQDAVILEDQGDLEIIVPEGMDSDGL